MQLLGLALAASALAAAVAIAAEPKPSAEEVFSRLTGELTDEQREAWFDSSAKAKAVAWVAPVFNVMASFGLVVVNGRVSERGLFACEVPERLEANAKRVKESEVVLCAGRIEGYERYSGAAIVNVIADDFVVGKRNIDAWEKAQKQKASKQ
jgi:hypothetical protein